jgi:hypothetical protein
MAGKVGGGREPSHHLSDKQKSLLWEHFSILNVLFHIAKICWRNEIDAKYLNTLTRGHKS